jgi:hypothetical protein
VRLPKGVPWQNRQQSNLLEWILKK